MSEQHNIEYKQSWHSLPRLVGEDHLKNICAHANLQGGKLYIGKDNKGNKSQIHCRTEKPWTT